MPVTLTSGTPRALQHATPRASTAPRIPPQRQFATAMPANNAPKPDHALVASLLPSISTPAAVLDPDGHMLEKTAQSVIAKLQGVPEAKTGVFGGFRGS